MIIMTRGRLFWERSLKMQMENEATGKGKTSPGKPCSATDIIIILGIRNSQNKRCDRSSKLIRNQMVIER